MLTTRGQEHDSSAAPGFSGNSTLAALKEIEIPGMDTPAFIPLIILPTAQKGKKKTKSKTNKNLPSFLW